MAIITVVFTDMAYELLGDKSPRSPEWKSLSERSCVNASSAVMARVHMVVKLNSKTYSFCFTRRPENGQKSPNGLFVVPNCAEQIKKPSDGYLFTHYMGASPGAILDTPNCRRDVYMDFAVKSDEAEKTLVYMEAIKLDPPEFRSLGSNCTTFTNKAIAEAGIDLGNLTGKSRLIRRPSDILRLFRNMTALLEPYGRKRWIGEVAGRPVQLVFTNKGYIPANAAD